MKSASTGTSRAACATPDSTGMMKMQANARVSAAAATMVRCPSDARTRRYSGQVATHRMPAHTSGKKKRCMTKAVTAIKAREKPALTMSRWVSFMPLHSCPAPQATSIRYAPVAQA
ncbi:hypothetical protein D9M69_703780 [compost metagenome]